MTFTKASYSKKINYNCKQLSNDNSTIKKCSDITLNCHYNKCLPYVVATENASVPEDEIKECNEKSKGNFKKSIKCIEKKMKKRGYLQANAKKGHCVSKKCPELVNFINDRIKDIASKISRKASKCDSKHCSKEINAKKQMPTEIEISNKCNLKYTDYKNQNKCFDNGVKKNRKVISKYYNCVSKHCSGKSSSSRKSSTKKSSKLSKK